MPMIKELIDEKTSKTDAIFKYKFIGRIEKAYRTN